MPGGSIQLTREEGLDFLSVLESAAQLLTATDFLIVLLAIEDAMALLVDKLYPV